MGMLQKSYILGVGVNFGLGMRELVSVIDKRLAEPGKFYITTVNPEFIVDAQNDEVFKQILNNSEIATPDGVGVLAARELFHDNQKKSGVGAVKEILTKYADLYLNSNKYAKSRLTGVDLFTELMTYCEKNSLSVAFIGGSNLSKDRDISVSTKLSELVHKSYPKINIVCNSSEFIAGKDDELSFKYINDNVIKKGLNNVDIVFVAYGHPKQEKWISNALNSVNGKLFIGVGGTFDFITGNRRRSSSVFINHNLEWLFRLFQEPMRFKRIYKATVVFTMLLYKELTK